MPASSSTIDPFTLNNYINITDSTNMRLTKDTTIIANDGLYTGRNAHTTLTEGKELICYRVRPHSGDTQGNTFSMEAGSTVQFTGSSGFADGGDNNRSLYRLNASGEAAVQIPNVSGSGLGINRVGVASIGGSDLDVEDSDFSIFAWVKPKSWISSYQTAVGYQSYSITLAFVTNIGNTTPAKVQCWLNNSQYKNSTASVALDEWSHIGIVYTDAGPGDTSVLEFYVNGALDSTHTDIQDIDTELSTLYFGQVSEGGSAAQYDGSVADVRIYNTALTELQVTGTLALINPATNVSGTYADPDNDLGAVGWWKCGATASGTLDLTNYGTTAGSYDGVGYGTKSGFCNIYRSNAGTWGLTPDRIKTGLNADSVWTLQNTYTGGDMADAIVCSGQTLVTKGTVGFD
jgi:hypothetical protein